MSRRRPISARVLALVPLLAACGGGGAEPATSAGDLDGDPDRGPIEATLDDADRTAWPGLDRARGRQINGVNGFFDGAPINYWFLGFASKNISDAFFFCREGDAGCPLDDRHEIAWSRLVGDPLFATIPGMEGYSPYWLIWLVRVGPDYRPDSIKTRATLDRWSAARKVWMTPLVTNFGRLLGDDVGPQEVALHCSLVLEGTTLKNNGGPLKGVPGRSSKRVELRSGWFEGHRVRFYDFAASEGVFPMAYDKAGVRNMPLSPIFVAFRNCDASPRPAICDIPGYPGDDPWRPVTERGVGADITGDGDLDDANTILPAAPCARPDPTDVRYSPLWRPTRMLLRPGFDGRVKLVDSYGDDSRSDVASIAAARKLLAEGAFEPFEPLTEDETGNPIRGNEGMVLFDCPVQVADDFAPFPCPAR